MIGSKNILPLSRTKNDSLFKRIISICFVLMTLNGVDLNAQVISTNGTVYITNASGTVVVTNTVENNSGSTLENNGSLTTGDLTNSGTLQGNGTYNLSSAFTNSGTFTAGSSTVDYTNTTGGQSVTALNYYNLTTSNTSGVNTLTGSIGIGNVFTPSAGALTSAGTSTVNFNNSTGGQSVPAFNYYNLTTSNTSGVNTLVGSIGISNVFTPSAGALTSAGASTVEYNNAGAQTITSFTYNNLTLTSAVSATKTLGGAVTVNGNLTVNVNNTMDDAGYQITGNAGGTFSLAAGTTLLLGNASTATTFPTNFTNGSTALNSTSMIVYNSDQPQPISAVPTYGHITLTSTASVTKTISGTLITTGDITVNINNILNITGTGDVTVGGNLNLYGNLTNAGIVTIGP